MKKISTYRITQTAMVSAVALVLSYIEMSLPDLPFVLPGMKLGLSNIATMFALSAMNLPCALVVCMVKAVFALLMRGFTAFMMSLCGGVLSVLAMYLLLKLKRVGFVGVGVGGAFCHNLGQILVAFAFTDSTVFAYFSVLGLASIITGTVTALAVYIILPKVLSLELYKQ
ncbi:MAG: Gx transporter family protein [Ruminococcus sp.]|nr:Gx transporter family protein [Ruminococcus sp.]MBQ7133447.1 Gx transporter family protein [Ruminococcus sp.]